MCSISLQTKSILHVPLRIYENDFEFIVNGEIFYTNKLVADLISTKISKQRLLDPTINQFIINTQARGNFQVILDLVNFNKCNIEETDIPFIKEIFEQLQPESIDINLESAETTIDNVFERLSIHEKYQNFYRSEFEKDIDFLSSNLFQLTKEKEEKFETLQYTTLECIFRNKKLKIESEDQLIRIINRLYQKSSEYSQFFEYVDFVNAEIGTINEFLSIFDIEDLTAGTWNKICRRFEHEITISIDEKSKRFSFKKKEIQFNGDGFDGIFNYLGKNSKIEEEVEVTRSSNGGGCRPIRLVNFEKSNNGLCTCSTKNEWICFELKKHKVIPNYYSIKTHSDVQNSYHPRTWVIEGSKDGKNWEKIDEQINCSYLNGSYCSHSFQIENLKQEDFKFIRMKLTDKNWRNDNYLCISAFELFGTLI